MLQVTASSFDAEDALTSAPALLAVRGNIRIFPQFSLPAYPSPLLLLLILPSTFCVCVCVCVCLSVCLSHIKRQFNVDFPG